MRKLTTFAALMAFAAPVPVLAQTAPPYLDLLRQSEASAPRLLEQDAAVRAAAGRADQASAWANPNLGLELEDFAGTGQYRGSNNRQTTLSLTEPVEFWGKRGARIGAARATLNATRLRQQQARADFGFDLALAYARAEAAQARIDIAAETNAASQDDLRAVKALVQAGKEATLRETQATAAAAAAQADAEVAKSDAAEAFARLSTLTGARAPYTGVTPSILTLTDQPLTLSGEVPAAAAIAIAEAESTAAAERTRAERLKNIPDLGVSVGVRKYANTNDTAMVAGISIPVPLFDFNGGAIAAARAEQTAADVRLSAARLEAETNWRTASAQAAASDARLGAARAAETAARDAYRLARIGYDAGRTPLFELLAARRALNEAQARLLDGKVARIEAVATLARLGGKIPFEVTP